MEKMPKHEPMHEEAGNHIPGSTWHKHDTGHVDHEGNEKRPSTHEEMNESFKHEKRH